MLTPPNTDITVREVISRDPTNHLVEQSIEYTLPAGALVRRLRTVQTELEQRTAEVGRLQRDLARLQRAERDAEIAAVDAAERTARAWHRLLRDTLTDLRDAIAGEDEDAALIETDTALIVRLDRAKRSGKVLAYGEDAVAAIDAADGEVITA